MLASPAAVVLLASPGALQVAGFLAIRRLGGCLVSPPLAAVCALLVAAALWELVAERGEGRRACSIRRRVRGRLRDRAAAAATRPCRRLERRIEDAALEGRVSPAAVARGEARGAALSLPAAAAAAPVAPGRLGSLVLIGVPLAAFLAPDLLLERRARARRRRLAAALPDALDLMATGAASGRSAGALLGEAMRSASGPLREELARAVGRDRVRRPRRRQRCGRSASAPAAAPSPTLAAALERSRRHGSPLSRALHEQAGSLRGEQRRAIAEHAARAAPKMQLVVALLLVPSVLLIVAAAIVANSGVAPAELLAARRATRPPRRPAAGRPCPPPRRSRRARRRCRGGPSR